MKSSVSRDHKCTVVVIYGTIAVGKLTVGKLLAKKLGYKLTHNHLINDLVLSVFDRGTIEAGACVEKYRFEFYETAVKAHQNLVITHCYSHEYVSTTGLSDPEYLRTLERKLTKAGARVFFIHLQADKKQLFQRVRAKSRKAFGKLTSVTILKRLLKTLDLNTSAPVKNNLVINNTDLSPGRVVRIIEEYIRQVPQ